MAIQTKRVVSADFTLEDLIMADIMEAVEQGREDFKMGKCITIEELEKEMESGTAKKNRNNSKSKERVKAN